ncbi:MAG: hypothetical protein COA79_00175 [Planctomycetota bacterium]|nr:MAG: hypothetical protein COA79_00175 [Planctomycetota bacterium]
MQKQLLKLSLGSGSQKIEGFKNVDINAAINPDFLMDITDLQFNDDSVDVLYASHVLEHLENKTTLEHKDFLLKVLRKWNNLLTHDGSLYICVPDIETISNALLENIKKTETVNSLVEMIYGGKRNKFDRHYFGFTKSTLSDLLIKAGYQNIEYFEPFVDDESKHKLNNKNISLNLVAHKSKNKNFIPPKFKPTQNNTLQEIADQRLDEIASLHLAIKELRESKIEAQNVHNKIQKDLLNTCNERLEEINSITATAKELQGQLRAKRSIISKAIDQFKKTDNENETNSD